MQTKVLAYHLQGSVTSEGWRETFFWRQTLSIVGGWRGLVRAWGRAFFKERTLFPQTSLVPYLTTSLRIVPAGHRNSSVIFLAFCMQFGEGFFFVLRDFSGVFSGPRPMGRFFGNVIFIILANNELTATNCLQATK